MSGNAFFIVSHGHRMKSLLNSLWNEPRTEDGKFANFANGSVLRMNVVDGRITCSLVHAGNLTNRTEKTYYVRPSDGPFGTGLRMESLDVQDHEISESTEHVPNTLPFSVEPEWSHRVEGVPNMTVYLMRHCDAEHTTMGGQRKKKQSGWGKRNTMLTINGVFQAIRTGQALNSRLSDEEHQAIKYLFSSDLNRTSSSLFAAFFTQASGRKILERLGRIVVLPCAHEPGSGMENVSETQSICEGKFNRFVSAVVAAGSRGPEGRSVAGEFREDTVMEILGMDFQGSGLGGAGEAAGCTSP